MDAQRAARKLPLVEHGCQQRCARRLQALLSPAGGFGSHALRRSSRPLENPAATPDEFAPTRAIQTNAFQNPALMRRDHTTLPQLNTTEPAGPTKTNTAPRAFDSSTLRATIVPIETNRIALRWKRSIAGEFPVVKQASFQIVMHGATNISMWPRPHDDRSLHVVEGEPFSWPTQTGKE